MTDFATPRYGWRLAILMADHKIRSGAELHRRLAAAGYDISAAQIARIMYDRPEQIKTALLDALGNVFGCSADEIMPVMAASVDRVHPRGHTMPPLS